MNNKLAKKIRKQYRATAEESIDAFKSMIRRQTLRRRIALAWKILINQV